jgi:hypothetical protein
MRCQTPRSQKSEQCGVIRGCRRDNPAPTPNPLRGSGPGSPFSHPFGGSKGRQPEPASGRLYGPNWSLVEGGGDRRVQKL